MQELTTGIGEKGIKVRNESNWKMRKKNEIRTLDTGRCKTLILCTNIGHILYIYNFLHKALGLVTDTWFALTSISENKRKRLTSKIEMKGFVGLSHVVVDHFKKN